MRVIKVEEATGRRYIVHLEDGRTFPIGRKEGKQLELEEGKELTEEQLEWIFQELVFPRGRNFLIYLLASKDYTVQEVREKLVKSCYPDEIIEDILCYGVERHYLDDLRYAQDYTTLHKQSKSIRQIRYLLSRKGISESILAQLEEENDPEDLLPKVRRYWEKKKGTNYEKNGKTYQYFVRKGYDSSLIRDLIRMVEEEE